MKKIISFSLYGNKPNFQVGAVVNVIEAKRVYPDWKCRFYTTDENVMCKQLEYLGAEVIRMDDWIEGKTLWRFLAVDDADVCIVRDADSVVNEKEALSVEQWLNGLRIPPSAVSGLWAAFGTPEWQSRWEEKTIKEEKLKWHRTHDHPHHDSFAMGAGMWGCNNTIEGEQYSLPDTMENMVREWTRRKPFYRFSDQDFLEEKVFPIAAHSMYTHGRQGEPFPPHPPIRHSRFIGDYAFAASEWLGFVR
jgi:hypothetical protein